jgi:hypothetical protein
MKAFFDWFNSQLELSECDPLRRVRDFIRKNGLPKDAVVGWSEKTADTVIAGYTRLGARRYRVDYRQLAYSPSNPSVSRTDRPPPENHRRWKGLFTRDAQAAWDFGFSASKFSPFFQSVSVLAAILRVSVGRHAETTCSFSPVANHLV